MREKIKNKILIINFSLFLVSIFAFLASIFFSLGQQVWFDESYSIWITKGRSFFEVISLTSVDAHPPLYYILLKIWGDIGNWNFFWLRILSILLFSISIFVAGKFAGKIFGKKIAVFSAGLVALSPFLLRYSYEIRMYSLASLISISSTFVFFEMMKSGSKKKLWIVYGALVSLGMWTLYTLALLFLSHFLIAVYTQWRKKNIKFWKENWFKSYLLAIILWLPWLSSFIYQLKNSASSGIGSYIDFKQIENAVSFLFFYKPQGEIFSLAIMLVFGLVFWLILKSKKHFKNAKILYFSAILPFTVTIILSQPIFLKKPFFVERYMSQFVILFYLVLVISIIKLVQNSSKVKQKMTVGIFSAILIIGLFNLKNAGNFNFQNYRHSNAGENMAKISEFCENKKLVMDDIYLFMELELYNKKCDLNIYAENWNFGGGYAPVNDFSKRITGEKELVKMGEIYIITAKDNPPKFVKDFSEDKNSSKFNNLSIYRAGK